MSTAYMQFYVADYLGDTRHLTTEQHGAYILLLMSMWRAGGYLPNDDKKLARLCGCTGSRWSKIRAEVMDFFSLHGEQITQKRLLSELEIAQEKAIKRAVSGSLGGRAKSLKDKKTAVANAVAMPCHSPEPEPLKKENTTYSPKKGTRLSPDWMPSEADQSFALKTMTLEGFRHEADQFRDYWISKPGAAGVKLDWPATWRTWVRRAGKGSPVAQRKNTGSGGRGDTSFADVRARRRAERGEGMEIPGGQASVSGDDLGWSEGAIDGQLAESHLPRGNGYDARLPF